MIVVQEMVITLSRLRKPVIFFYPQELVKHGEIVYNSSGISMIEHQ